MLVMDMERRKLCEDVRFAIKDEEEAVVFYKKIESQLNASDNPAVRALGLAVETVTKDEEKHKNVLEKIERLLCLTF